VLVQLHLIINFQHYVTNGYESSLSIITRTEINFTCKKQYRYRLGVTQRVPGN